MAAWVFPEPGWSCAECGFDFDATDPTTVAEKLAKGGKRMRAPLTRGLKDEDLDTILRTRPEPDHWSALEYACHIRDAVNLNTERFTTLQTEDQPTFVAFDVDGAVSERKYNEQDPSVVADELDAAFAGLVAVMEAVPADGWAKFGVRGERQFSLDWMARNVQHEVDHHMLDIGRTLRTVRGR